MFNSIDCTNGFEILISHPAVTIVSGHAEQLCLTSSGGPKYDCVDGELNEAATSITFPDNRGPEGCLYLRARIELAGIGSL